MAKWHVIRKQKTFGPFTDEQLQKLASSGKLKPDDGVQREGSEHVVKARTIRELFPDLQPPASEPAPPLKAAVASDPWFTQDELRKFGTVCLGVFLIGLFGIRSCSQLKEASSVLSSKALTLKSEDDVYALKLIGKSQEDVMKLLGKPAYVFPSGRLIDGRTYAEDWKYEGILRHPVTGQRQHLQIFFNRSRQAIGWDIE